MAHSNSNIDIHDETNYDPTVWVPEQHSHGTKDIWMKFWILSFLTIIDIVLYFTMDPSMMRNWIFIILGIFILLSPIIICVRLLCLFQVT